MNPRGAAAVLTVLLALPLSACSVAATSADATTDGAISGSKAVTIPTESGNVAVPAGTGGTMGSGSGTAGPGEKENQRGNTPPGMSRDGAGPAGGAIVDPSGAATGKR
jgi:hypothetical protein